ncbi:MAG: SMP-30/gluconolactonase/LRE family protein [Ilumatobacteraceae bacterium]
MDIETWKAELLSEANLELGEGAIWHPQWRQFLYVDIEHGVVGAIDPETRQSVQVRLDKRVGTVVAAGGNNLVVAVQGSIDVLNFETGERKPLTPIEADKPTNRCNDGKCDAAGRLWIGTMHPTGEQGTGSLYRYDGALHTAIQGTAISNGICWTADQKTMYYIDSANYHVLAYDFDLHAGTIFNPRIVAAIDPPAMPDGMCIDQEGMLWVAIWGGNAVHRYDPSTGNLIGKVDVDAPHVTSCALGGKDMQQLFITTAKAGLSPDQLAQFPLSGSLFMVDVPYRGIDPHFFKCS